MTDKKTDRSNCRFAVQMIDGKHILAVQLYQDTIPVLKDVAIGFDLLGGTRVEDARKLADLLNERVIDIFATSGK
jgi:hypothetical protein